MDQLNSRYHLDVACAYIRGSLTVAPAVPDEELFQHGLAAGLRLHKFKRMSLLPRVSRVFGYLHQLIPQDLLDIGTGRGAFLWPLLGEFKNLRIHCMDVRNDRVRDIRAVSSGGITRLTAEVGDVTRLPMANASVDGVTMLEVLEHLADPERAIAETLRVSRRFVIVSVPSKPDDNPEHIHLFTERKLTALFQRAGVSRISIDHVLNHMVALATVKGDS
ncbi:MAG: class I SAM-dependent methyltransferase [Pirellulaceae bacterium]